MSPLSRKDFISEVVEEANKLPEWKRQAGFHSFHKNRQSKIMQYKETLEEYKRRLHCAQTSTDEIIEQLWFSKKWLEEFINFLIFESCNCDYNNGIHSEDCRACRAKKLLESYHEDTSI